MSEILSDLEWMNLSMLAIIRTGLAHDRAVTCCRYGLATEQADCLLLIGLDDLYSLVIDVGDTTLFPPRPDLVNLPNVPRPLAGALALVRRPGATTTRRPE